jgi:vacuolar-type H+-ATPase subunit I/STV1
MEKILARIGEFSGALGDFRAEVSKVISEIAGREEKLGLGKIEQDTRNKDLDVREAEIKKVENIISLSESNKKGLKEIEEKLQFSAKTQQDFNNYRNEQTKIINEGLNKNKKDAEHNQNESKALSKLREDLEKDKDNFKLNIAKGLAAQGEKIRG